MNFFLKYLAKLHSIGCTDHATVPPKQKNQTLKTLSTNLNSPSPGPEAPVKITSYPTDANVPPYVDVMFNCTATGNPPPQITWRQNGRSLPDDPRLA